ncbi:hypothetical protein FVE85_3318 [Porphyridium purpureum]|uniref:Hedgehog protein Hint domain-containing protein n=1 Tax=Porphyridium purpureum TaxID=35688 RepID=A0A5J4YX88_PORPP|nr:hypothetical protein FVE85_3318 [Porphyridium purpureum]|eukprot:POR4181..scf227_4
MRGVVRGGMGGRWAAVVVLAAVCALAAAQNDVDTVSSVRICVYGDGVVGDQDELLRQCRADLLLFPPFTPPRNAVCVDYPNNFCVLGTGRLRPLFEAARMNCFPRTTDDKCGGFRTDQWQYNISALVPPTQCILDGDVIPNVTFVSQPDSESPTFGCFRLFSNQAFRFECSECLDQPECFSEDAQVRTMQRDGSVLSKPLVELVAGDRVESYSQLDGAREFTTLMHVEHADVRMVRELLLIHHSKGASPLRVTPSHLLVSADPKEGVIAARDVSTRTQLVVMSESGVSEKSQVTRIDRVSGRVLNPQTENMRIVVDGVLASCWTDVSVGGVSLARLPGLTVAYRLLSRMRLFSVVRYIDDAVHRMYSGSGWVGL